MPRVVLDIPSDKMQSFISAISPLGIGGSIRTYKYSEKKAFQSQTFPQSFEKNFGQFYFI